MQSLITWFNGKKTYIGAFLLWLFSMVQNDPTFTAYIGSHAPLVGQALALYIMWARSQAKTGA